MRQRVSVWAVLAMVTAVIGVSAKAEPLVPDLSGVLIESDLGFGEFADTTVDGGPSTGDFFLFGAPVTGIAELPGETPDAIDLFFNVNLDDLTDFGAALFVTGPDGDVVTSTEGAMLGFDEDEIHILFDDASGSAAASFPYQILVTIVFEDGFGENPFGALTDGGAYDVAIRVEATAVPLPAAALLFVGGGAALAGLRRLRRHAA